MLDAREFANLVVPLLAHNINYTFVWEVTHVAYTSFKDISGVVRRQAPQKGLVYNLFDFTEHDGSPAYFSSRMASAKDFLSEVVAAGKGNRYKLIPQYEIKNLDTLNTLSLEDRFATPYQEGWVVRSHDAPFKPGRRHWDYQKIVREPTSDLRIIRYEEGAGKNAGGVGRLIAEYNGKEIGVGPGKMSYAQRQEEWKKYKDGVHSSPRIAQIKYKKDDSYSALRQATFQCWRPDKTEPDA